MVDENWKLICKDKLQDSNFGRAVGEVQNAHEIHE